MRMKMLFPVLFLAAGMLPLAAQETEAGIQGALVFPQSDLRSATDGRIGFTLGVHGGIDLQGGNELRPRIDYTRVDGGSFSLSSLKSTTTVQAVGIGVDYLYYLEHRRRGSYAVGGLELNWWEAQYRFRSSERETSPSVMIGVGHRFNASVAMEFNLDYGQFRPSMGSASSIKGGVFYRF
ncbi:MAG: outer membrane beta-barrel protein [Holophaga sp.]|nr:outer membrane beta-barrel protein [Holophaga sp.]